MNASKNQSYGIQNQSSPHEETAEFRTSIQLMGTTIILYFKGKDAEIIVEEAVRKLEDFEKRFSANSDQSQLARLRKHAFISPQKVDPDVYNLIKIGLAHSMEAESFLNIAIGPLIKLWKVGFKEANLPDPKSILKTLDLIDPHNILIDDDLETVFFNKEGMEIDLGAIAKGYFADRIMAFFKENLALSALVDIGGNVLVFGDSPKKKGYWQVGIQNPFLPRGQVVGAVQIRNQSAVTSGIYERVLKTQAKKYHHIFDSNTGYPIENDIASLTIISDSSLDCDLFTTKLFGFEANDILRHICKNKEIEGIIITKEGDLAYTKGLEDKIVFKP